MSEEQDPYKNPYTPDIITPDTWGDMSTAELTDQLTVLKQRAWTVTSLGHTNLTKSINFAIDRIEQELSQRTQL